MDQTERRKPAGAEVPNEDKKFPPRVRLTVHLSLMLVSLGSLVLNWILGLMLYNSIVAQRGALLEAKADASEVSELRGQLEAKAPKSTQEALQERTERNTEDLRELRAKMDDLWAWTLTAYKNASRDPPPPPKKD